MSNLSNILGINEGQEFEFRNRNYLMDENLKYCVNSEDIIDIINHTEEIIPINKLEFSNDERAFLRLIYQNGYKWIAKNPDGKKRFYIFKEKPNYLFKLKSWSGNSSCRNISNLFLQQITYENSPVEISKYMNN